MNFEEFKAVYQKKKVVEVGNTAPKQPLLSICVQTYQHKKFIRNCIDGILLQKVNFDIEILIGEDNSDDGTREICLEYAKKYPDKIRLFLHNRKNQIKVSEEPTSNFNAFYNFFSVRGKYIAFCEGDDYWTDPLKSQKQVDFLENNPDYVFSYHKYEIIDQDGKNLKDPTEIRQPKRDINATELLAGEYHPLLLSICYRNILKEIPREITEVINVDTFLLSLLGNYGGAKFQIEIQPAKYRKHPRGIWSSRIKKNKYLSKIKTLEKLSSFYLRKKKLNLHKLYKNKKINIYKMLIIYNLKKGDFNQAFHWFLKLFKTFN